MPQRLGMKAQAIRGAHIFHTALTEWEAGFMISPSLHAYNKREKEELFSGI